ncbi:hypothetical protein CXB51_014279 [Gossypium anomalum]|uniref:Uncharacterized protein n=1 Tax=Gossypium anomalum TaxID=47600 RepID=A0A8J5YKD8_9ROSI|nr:hypothetical protein CXB51_014279 [Gossypium anomalum]
MKSPIGTQELFMDRASLISMKTTAKCLPESRLPTSTATFPLPEPFKVEVEQCAKDCLSTCRISPLMTSFGTASTARDLL